MINNQPEQTQAQFLETQLAEFFKKTWTQLRAKKFTHFRPEDKIAFFSPQRDAVHILSLVNSMTKEFARYMFSEEELKALGNLPSLLYHAFKGEEGGFPYLLEIMGTSAEEAPEATNKYMQLFLLTLFAYLSHLPACAVTDFGTVCDESTAQVGVEVAMDLVSDPEVKEKMQESLDNRSVRSDFFIEGLKQLKELDNQWVAEMKKKYGVSEESEGNNG